MKKGVLVGASFLVLAGTPERGVADSPGQIHYQGRIVQGSALYSGPLNLQFRLYDAPSGGTMLHYSTNYATAIDGLYATVIGEYTVSGSLVTALTNEQVWLEVTINGVTLNRREQLLAVPFAEAVKGLRIYPQGSLVLNPELGNNVVRAGSFNAIAGGRSNTISSAHFSWIGGGLRNLVETNADYSSVLGGFNNKVLNNSRYCLIAGGKQNSIAPQSDEVVIAGGESNVIMYSSGSVILGGFNNSISTNSNFSTINGGAQNRIDPNAMGAVILGGNNNRVGYAAHGSLVGGAYAWADHQGSFVWGDKSSTNYLVSAEMNSVNFRASGGYRFFTNPQMTLGAELPSYATAWSALSDRDAKENIEPVDPERILAGIKELPLSSWSYKFDPTHRRYMGPMAQDFHTIFGLGEEKTINTLDADGVLFAAVQALVHRSEQLARENEMLRKRLEEVERLLSSREKGAL